MTTYEYHEKNLSMLTNKRKTHPGSESQNKLRLNVNRTVAMDSNGLGNAVLVPPVKH